MPDEMPRQPEPEVMDIEAEAEAYAVADFADVNQAFTERLVALAGHIERARAVDLGTGPGDVPVRVARAMPGWHITAVDASEPMLRHARQAAAEAGLADRIEPVLADAKDTPLPSAAFDVVFSNSILHHITETGALWAEVRRLGSPGAPVLIRDLFRPASVEAAEEIVHRYASGESGLLREEFHRSLLSAYTVEEVRHQLFRAGLNTLRVEPVSDRHLDVFGTLR
jgi:ubiquinone/menaquinone biosynthesis C-methylase UbiE